jgi:transcriptional regulator with XRE-family HTH domain
VFPNSNSNAPLDPDALADRLRSRVAERGLNQRELAKAVGTHYNVVARWLSGERLPSAPHLVGLAHALKTSTDWLLLGDSTGPPAEKPDTISRQLAELAPTLARLAALADEAAAD